MLAVQTYRPEVYSALPDLCDAASKFKALNGAAAVEKSFKDLFRRHGMEKKFGLTMAHRHFDMAKNERLVEYGTTSTPWVMDNDSDSVKPHCWVLGADGVTPYEFRYDPSGKEEELKIDFNDAKIQAFAREFVDLVDSIGGTGLFGLCTHPGGDFEGRLEITQGRANINIPLSEVPEFMKPNVTDAAWFFHKDEGPCGCFCYTTDDGKHGGHATNSPRR
ncbi:hypothetical protein PpBr36_00617 [Pyricularia pennisetigena]|uniref:hypothetical protein n=1 Tax=Pyricularia pennisetigena TaxID=1578925 RepID=UPI001153BE3F|nr:hypothetical protein PpBr36_00617 [Pyricularia pennisetigena]TLS28629.1 hypothetical protein PpBr36_00617 [Pyricularia pennisetigena]